MGTELSAKNKIQAIGSLAVPVLIYTFGTVNRHQEELQKLDRKMRKLLTIHGQHHPQADVDRLYDPRKQGGRGLMQLEAAHAVEITNLWLKCGDNMGETESTTVATQDQAISTNYFKNKILKEKIESKCRLCKQHEETIDHLTSGCPIWQRTNI